jgi:hypothetical protein
VVKVVVPLGDGLQAVHHACVKAVGGGCGEEEEDPTVEQDDAGWFSAWFTLY